MDRDLLINELRNSMLHGATVSTLVEEIERHHGSELSDRDFVKLFTDAFCLEPHSGNSLLLEWRNHTLENAGSGDSLRFLFPHIIRNQKSWREGMDGIGEVWLDKITPPSASPPHDDDRLISEWEQLSQGSKDFILQIFRSKNRLYQELGWMACLAERLAQQLIDYEANP